MDSCSYKCLPVPVFRVIVTLKSGEQVGPAFVKAQSREQAVAVAHSHGLVMDGEKVSAALMNGNTGHIDFGPALIVIGKLES
jgi:hypothetical protein